MRPRSDVCSKIKSRASLENEQQFGHKVDEKSSRVFDTWTKMAEKKSHSNLHFSGNKMANYYQRIKRNSVKKGKSPQADFKRFTQATTACCMSDNNNVDMSATCGIRATRAHHRQLNLKYRSTIDNQIIPRSFFKSPIPRTYALVALIYK